MITFPCGYHSGFNTGVSTIDSQSVIRLKPLSEFHLKIAEIIDTTYYIQSFYL